MRVVLVSPQDHLYLVFSFTAFESIRDGLRQIANVPSLQRQLVTSRIDTHTVEPDLTLSSPVLV